MKRTLWSLVALAACLLVTTSVARADEYVYRSRDVYSRQHFLLGAEAVGSVMLNQLGGGPRFLSHGGGPNLFLGGRVARHVGLEFGWQPGFHDSYNGDPAITLGRDVRDGLALTALTFDVKIFPVGGVIQPYFAVGPSLNFLTDWELRYLAAGPGWQIGGGVDFWVLPVLSIGFKSQYRGFGLRNYDSQGRDGYFSMVTFAANLTGHF